MELTKVNYVDQAEKVVNSLAKNKNGLILTTSKIRSILTMTARISNEAKREKGPLSQEEQGDVQLLRMKLVYEYGRNEDGVQDFLKKAELIEKVKDIGDSREDLLLFCKYMEALVAYHRYQGGKD